MATRKKTCRNCLWNWPDLLGGAARKCYQNGSRYYRRCVCGAGTCALYERRASLCDWAPYWPKDETTRKGGENHGGDTQ